jgi:steroid 5-alpha reductase family enzyme
MIDFPVILQGWLLLAAIMAILWVVQLWRQEADIVDVGWSGGLGLLAIHYALHCDGLFARRMLVGTLVIIWSYRLASYLFRARVLVSGEDGRYEILREKWGARAQRNFFFYFQAQALAAVIFSLPFYILMLNAEERFSIWEMLAMLVWVLAIAGETIADKQLAMFRKNPDNFGKTCRHGLWKYSRHPNYFFEWLHWWTYVFMGVGIPYGLVTFIGPVLILYLFLKVTGIPPVEAKALKSRGDDYREYQRTTSVFFPWFPKA